MSVIKIKKANFDGYINGDDRKLEVTRFVIRVPFTNMV